MSETADCLHTEERAETFVGWQTWSWTCNEGSWLFRRVSTTKAKLLYKYTWKPALPTPYISSSVVYRRQRQSHSQPQRVRQTGKIRMATHWHNLSFGWWYGRFQHLRFPKDAVPSVRTRAMEAILAPSNEGSGSDSGIGYLTIGACGQAYKPVRRRSPPIQDSKVEELMYEFELKMNYEQCLVVIEIVTHISRDCLFVVKCVNNGGVYRNHLDKFIHPSDWPRVRSDNLSQSEPYCSRCGRTDHNPREKVSWKGQACSHPLSSSAQWKKIDWVTELFSASSPEYDASASRCSKMPTY